MAWRTSRTDLSQLVWGQDLSYLCYLKKVVDFWDLSRSVPDNCQTLNNISSPTATLFGYKPLAYEDSITVKLV